MFRLNLTKHCIKWYCFIQMQLMDTFVHYFVLEIDKILTEEWVMTYIPAVSWSVFLLFCYTI